MISKKIQIAIMLSGLAIAVGGCQSSTLTPPISTSDNMDCRPASPQLESYSVDEGGVYYPKTSMTNLLLYIQQLNACIDYHQMRPG